MRGLCVKSWGFSRETSGGASTTLKIGVSTPFNTHGLAGMLVQKHEGLLNEMNVIHGAPCACSLLSTCPCFCPCLCPCLSSVSKGLIPAVMSPSRKKKKACQIGDGAMFGQVTTMLMASVASFCTVLTMWLHVCLKLGNYNLNLHSHCASHGRYRLLLRRITKCGCE